MQQSDISMHRIFNLKSEVATQIFYVCVFKRLSDVTYLIGVEKGDNCVVHHHKFKMYAK